MPRHVGDLAEALDPDRFAVEVACPVESQLWARLEGLPHIRLRRLGPARGPARGDPSSAASLIGPVRSADIVHAHSSKAGVLARFVAARLRRAERCVFTPHAWSFWSVDGARRRAVEMVERRAARWCRTIIAVSMAERDAGLRAAVGRPTQYRVIPNGIDLARFAGARHAEPGRVLVVGRLARQKRPDVVLAAISQVAAANPAARLDFVGEGPLRAELEEAVRRRMLTSVVRLLGERSDVPELLSSAACVVLASEYESLSISLMEAMAAGVPVIATRVGGTAEIISDGVTGLLIEHGRPADLATAILEVLSDPTRAEEMGAAARARARQAFSLRSMVESTVAVYQEILDGRAGVPEPRRRR